MTTTTDAPAFYDHATNAGGASPAEGSAMARARRTAIDNGQAYRVEANWTGKGRFYWDGCRYDALGLAKSLVANRAENVVMTRPDGATMDANDIRHARY